MQQETLNLKLTLETSIYKMYQSGKGAILAQNIH